MCDRSNVAETFELPPHGQHSFPSGIDGVGECSLDVFAVEGRRRWRPSTSDEANVASHVLVSIHEADIEVSIEEE